MSHTIVFFALLANLSPLILSYQNIRLLFWLLWLLFGIQGFLLALARLNNPSRSLCIGWLMLNLLDLFIKLNQRIVAESPFLKPKVCRPSQPFPFLHSPPPLSFVVTAIVPKHLSVTLTQVSYIMTLIHVTSAPSKNTIAFLLVFHILTLVLVRVTSFFPGATTIPEAVSKVSFVEAAIGPIVLPISMWFAHKKGSFIEIPRTKLLGPLTMLQILFELPFVSVSVYPNMHPVSISLAEFPLADIAISLCAVPHPRAMFVPNEPLSFVEFTIRPLKAPHSLRLAINIKSLVYCAVFEQLITFSMLEVALPFSFVLPTSIIEHNSVSVPLAVDELAVEASCTILFEFEMF